jgi:hypothetical protein
MTYPMEFLADRCDAQGDAAVEFAHLWAHRRISLSMPWSSSRAGPAVIADSGAQWAINPKFGNLVASDS